MQGTPFQYNSCYCLSNLRIFYCWNCCISIQLLLLFIPKQTSWLLTLSLFQYNSCYCLSSFRELPWLVSFYFNTTPVTVYHVTLDNTTRRQKFQYNSCYCLSAADHPEYKRICRFQYNSCYCLSIISFLSSVLFMQFQYNSCYCLSKHSCGVSRRILDFNTTPVTVYP